MRRPRGAKRPNVPPMRNPRDFAKPLAIGAPAPVLEVPFRPSRMIHFLDFSNEKMVAKVPDIAPTVDILLGNLEDAVPVDRKLAAREGLVRVGREMELGETQLWTRTVPRSGLDLDSLTSSTSDSQNSVSPWNTGAGWLSSSVARLAIALPLTSETLMPRASE